MKAGALRAAILGAAALVLAASARGAGPEKGDYLERFDTLYNSLTVERRGTVVELRARSRAGEFLESAVDLADPLRLVVPYTRSLYGALFLQPKPRRVLMIGLGGAGFPRLFTRAFPEATLHSVELDAKVLELCQTHLGFTPTARTPVTILDGRLFVKRNREQWDWIILDAFRGGYVPPHLKTEEFYRECAARLGERGVFVSNLHSGTGLYLADLATISAVFPQVVLFQTKARGNVIACAVNYREPDITDQTRWPSADELSAPFGKHLDLAAVRREQVPLPRTAMARAKVMTDDFAPVEYLDAIKSNNESDAGAPR